MKGISSLNRALVLACIAFLTTGSCVTLAGDWPAWRGPTGLGYTDEKDLPLTWNGKTGENIIWKSPIAGYNSPKADFSAPGHSSPIVWKDRIFITTSVWPADITDEKERRKVIAAQHVVCYRTTDGKELWDAVIPAGPITNNNVYMGYAVSTPATDGKLVFALFNSGTAVALDFDGKIVWQEELPGMKNPDGGFGMSPVIFEDLVIVPGFGKMGLRALDKKTGKVKWEQAMDPKKPMPTNTHSTPALIRINGKMQLIHYAGGVQSFDPATGELLWYCRGIPSSWASPAFGKGLLYVDEGRGGKFGNAVDASGMGDVSKTHVKWKTDVTGAAGTSSVVVGDYLYRICDQGLVRCWNLGSGEVEFEKQLKNITPSASPIVTADGRIYFASPKKTYVIKASSNYELLATNDLEIGGNSQDYTTPAVSEGRFYFKGRTHLWCVGTR